MDVDGELARDAAVLEVAGRSSSIVAPVSGTAELRAVTRRDALIHVRPVRRVLRHDDARRRRRASARR